MTFLAEVPWFFTHVFPWGFIVTGGGCFLDALTAIIRASESHRWPTVTGTVTRSCVERVVFDDHGHSRDEPRLEYRYVVDGKEFKGTRVAASVSAAGSDAEAMRLVRQLKTGAEVEVRYLPSDPQTSLLRPGIRGRLFVNLVFALLTLAVGIGLLLWLPQIGKLPHATC